jgi:hypothetical protein
MSVLLSVLFDDVAAEIDADTYPAAVLHRLGLPDRVLVLVQLVDIGVAAIFNPVARLPLGGSCWPPSPTTHCRRQWRSHWLAEVPAEGVAFVLGAVL